MYQIMLTFDSEEIISHSLMDGKKSRGYVLSADLSVLTHTRSDGYMIFMVCFSALLVLLFVVLPIFLLCFYPTKILRNLLSKCLSSRFLIFLNTFMEKFHYSYRDGLDGTKDMRSFSGIYFLLRIMIYSAEAFSRATSYQVGSTFCSRICFLSCCSHHRFKSTLQKEVHEYHGLHLAISFGNILLYNSINYQLKWQAIFLPMMYVMLAFPFISIFLLAIYRITYGMFRKFFRQWSTLPQCSACLKNAKVEICSCFKSQNLSSPETTITYGTIN